MRCRRSGAPRLRPPCPSDGSGPPRNARRSCRFCAQKLRGTSLARWCRSTAASAWAIDRFTTGGSHSMERADALATIKEVAAEVLSVEPDQVEEGARFKEDLDADSLDLVELVMGLEERFDIEVPEEDLEGVTTVGQAVDLVLSKAK